MRRSDVEFFDGEHVLAPLHWHKATGVRVRFRGHKGDQSETGACVTRVRDVARGASSQIGAGGGAVAVLVELMACHLALPEDAPLCSFRCRRSKTIKVWGYSKAPSALRQIVEKAGGDPKQVGLHSLRIGAATTLWQQEETYRTELYRERVDGRKARVRSKYILGIIWWT